MTDQVTYSCRGLATGQALSIHVKGGVIAGIDHGDAAPRGAPLIIPALVDLQARMAEQTQYTSGLQVGLQTTLAENEARKLELSDTKYHARCDSNAWRKTRVKRSHWSEVLRSPVEFQIRPK